MPRKVICENCKTRIRAFKLRVHLEKRCIARPINCEHCNIISSVSYHESHHGKNCDLLKINCKYCQESILLKDLEDHTAHCFIIKQLIEKYKPFNAENIVQIMKYLHNLYTGMTLKVKHGNYKLLLFNLIKERELGLEAIICLKQFNYNWLYHFVIVECLRKLHQPKECIVEDVDMILGEHTNMYYVCDVLRTFIGDSLIPRQAALSRSETFNESGVLNNTHFYYRFDRLYCDKLFYVRDFISDYDLRGLKVFEDFLKNTLLDHLTADTTGIIMEYMFAKRLIIGRWPY